MDIKSVCLRNVSAHIFDSHLILKCLKNLYCISYSFPQFSRKLDDLLEILYNDREADTVQAAQDALIILKEKVDAIGL